MKDAAYFLCSSCGSQYEPEGVVYTCPKDDANLEYVPDFSRIARAIRLTELQTRAEPSLWRYLPFLPVGDPGAHGTPLRQAGWTPLYRAGRLAAKTGVRALWVKDESSNPTASFKDRASAVVVARAREIGAEIVVTASSGNAGAALAGMAAAVEQRSIILVPRTAPQAKIAQLLVFGAEVILVDGTYDDAFDLSLAASRLYGWYCRNTGYNPFTLEGKKTAAYEIWEQLSADRFSWDTQPLTVFVSVGDGNIIAGIHKGFRELVQLGWLRNMPRLLGVQAEGSAAVANAYRLGVETITAVKADTIADSISVGLPRDGLRALRAATQTGGAYLTVSDAMILEAIADLGRMGIFAEPAGAAAYAGMVAAAGSGLVGADDAVVVVNTGSGLKDIHSAMQAVGQAPIIAPNLQALEKNLRRTR